MPTMSGRIPGKSLGAKDMIALQIQELRSTLFLFYIVIGASVRTILPTKNI